MGSALRLLAIGASLVWLVFGNAPDATRLWRAAFNAGHVPLFGLLALMVDGLLRRWMPERSRPFRAALTVAGVLALGLVVEGLQLLTPDRSASVLDLTRNAAGAVAALALDAAWRERAHWTWRRRVAALACACVLSLAGTYGALRTAGERWMLKTAMPRVVGFDGAWWERDVVVVSGGVLVPTGAHVRVARLRLEPGSYSGITVDEPYRDWRGYDVVELQIEAPRVAEVRLSIRINDALHDNRYSDRFNRRLSLHAGWNTVQIPLDEVRLAPRGREMDMASIRKVVLFVHELPQSLELGLGPILLTRK